MPPSTSPSTSPRRTAAAKSARRSPAVRRTPTRRPGGDPQPAAAVDPIEAFVRGWTPRALRCPPPCWDAINDVVTSAVLAAAPGGVEFARKLLVAMTRHTAARYAAGMRIDDLADLLSDEALAEVWRIDNAMSLSPASRRTALGYLRGILARALPHVYGKPPELVLPREAIIEPYTDADIAAMRAWATTSTQASAGAAHAALLLGLGCGLDGLEAPAVRGSDVHRTPWGLVVAAPGTGTHAGSRPRRFVGVAAAYEHALSHVAHTAGSRPLLENRDYARTAVAMRRTPGLPPLSGARLRVTWTYRLLVEHVSFLVPRTAGVSISHAQRLTALADRIRVDDATYVTQLRGVNATPFDAAAHTHLATWSPR